MAIVGSPGRSLLDRFRAQQADPPRRPEQEAHQARMTATTQSGDPAINAMNGFVAAASDIDGIVRITARSLGLHVDFVVTVRGRAWHEVIDVLEPRLRALYLSGAASIDYSVIEIGRGEADGPGFLELYVASDLIPA